MGSLINKHKLPGEIKPIEDIKKRDIINQITFSTFCCQILNSNDEFIKMLNDFVPQISQSMFMDSSKVKSSCQIFFDDIISNTINTILTTDKLHEIIKDNIVPTNDFILNVIVDLIYEQYYANNFFVTNFPKFNVDLIQPCLYTEKLYSNSTKTLNDAQYKFYFNNFCNQTSIDIHQDEFDYKNLSYSYHIDKSTFEYISHQTSYELDDPQHIGHPYIISFTKVVIVFEVLNHGYLNRIINHSTDKGNRFTFFPLSYIILGEPSGHACFIVFDNIYKSVFLLDPNGTTNFLTRYIVGKDTDEDDQENISLPYITDAFNNYIDIFNKWNDTNYIFYSDATNINLNFRSQYDYTYDIGHCQPTSLLLIRLLYMHQDMFSDNVLKDFNTILRNIDLRSLIRTKYNFSANMLRILQENKLINLVEFK